MKRKPGQSHKGWKASAKKYKVSGVWRTGIPQRMRRKADIVNDFFRKHYPADWDTAWEMRHCGSSYGREYIGDRNVHSIIFPGMVCSDGFAMSVQGHFGAYSYPRDDFADEYRQVEIMCPREEILEELGRGYDVGDERIYPYVDIAKVLKVIEKHGGLVVSSTDEK